MDKNTPKMLSLGILNFNEQIISKTIWKTVNVVVRIYSTSIMVDYIIKTENKITYNIWTSLDPGCNLIASSSTTLLSRKKHVNVSDDIHRQKIRYSKIS